MRPAAFFRILFNGGAFCRILGSATLLLVLTLRLPAQKPEFEAASVKPEPRGPGTAFFPPKGGPGTEDPTTWRYRRATLSALIGLAYEKTFYEISAPEWMNEDLFTVDAKVPPGATKEAFRLMLRNLLENRFALRLHHETKQMPGYVLTVAKGGPKFHSTVPDPNPAKPVSEAPHKDENGYPAFPRGSGITMAIMNDKARFHLTNETMEHFSEQMSSQVRGPVRDQTGLHEKYDLDLYRDVRTIPSPDGDPGPDLIHAVKEQLGLSLEARKVPVEIVVIDHADRIPTEN